MPLGFTASLLVPLWVDGARLQLVKESTHAVWNFANSSLHDLRGIGTAHVDTNANVLVMPLQSGMFAFDAVFQ